VTPEVGVLSEGAEDVVGAAYPNSFLIILFPCFSDVLFGIAFARLVSSWYQPQVSSNLLAALGEARGIFEGEHQRQGGEHSHAVDLPQELGLWVELLSYILQLAIVVFDALGQRGYGLQDRLQGSDVSSPGKCSATFL
jgi:hypothetical protein